MHTVAGDDNENSTENTKTTTPSLVLSDDIATTQGRQFYCPQGKKFNSSSTHFDDKFVKAFEENCQCDCCKYGEMFPNHDFGCTAPFGLGEDLENNYNAKAACVIHDHCYDTIGTTQEACDNEFRENLKIACKDSLTPDDCEDVINFYFRGLQTFGVGFFQPFNDCPESCICRNRIISS